jgi:hypothetical protein
MRKMFVVAALLCAACGGSGSDNTPATPTAATPAFSVPAGTKSDVISVAITTTTAGAAIHYTTDGVDPTAASSTYTAPLALSTATTLKAIATASGYNASAVASAAYTFQAATPTFSVAGGTYATPQSVTISTATPGATVYYTTDGSTPTTSSTAYATSISLSVDPSTTTIKAIAFRTGFTNSGVASATYTIDSSVTPAATPTFNPVAGTYPAAQDVTITCATAGATIHYTTDGSAPTAASAVYTTAVHVAASLTLKAIASAPGHTASAVGSAAYTINLPPAATPTFSPGAGSYSSPQSVTVSSTTPGAVIHCTTNGTPATAASPVCTTVSVATTLNIRAVATAAGYTTSPEATAAYTIASPATMDFATFFGTLTAKEWALDVSCNKTNPGLYGPSYTAMINSYYVAAQKDVTAGLATFSSTVATACNAAIQALTCSDLDPAGGLQTWPAACNGLMAGTVVNSGNCYHSFDCANGYCTSEHTMSCPGTCQPYVQLSGSCANADCAPNLVCGTSGFCRAAGALNASCPCQDGLWCDPSAGPTGTCKAPKTSGACTGIKDECAVGYACDGSNCAPVRGGGQSCGTGEPCADGYNCTGSVCTSWPTVNEACVGSEPCLDSFCLSGTCTAYPAVGVCSAP